MNDRFCIIVQGPTVADDVSTIKKAWGSFPIIFSTWEDADKACYTPDDIVLFNKYPDIHGRKNFNLQKISSLNGIQKAKDLGFSRVLKWRNDFTTNNGSNLTKLFNTNCLNFYAFIPLLCGYVTDFFIEGDVDDMLALFSIPNISNSAQFPEFYLTKNMYHLGLNAKANFVCKQLTRETNIYWKKLDYWLTKNINDTNYSDQLPKEISEAYK
jgi:hypothetical protein